MAGTSPSIAAPSAGGYEIAFQASTGSLSEYSAAGTTNTTEAMMAGSSPPHHRAPQRRLRDGVPGAARLPRKAEVTITCRGRGCPRRSLRARTRKLGRLLASLDGLVYRAGDRLYITISAPGYVDERAEFVIKNGAIPAVKLL